MATLPERFLFLSFFCVIIRRRVFVERRVESFDIFIVRVRATLPVPQKRREDHNVTEGG